MRKQYNKRSIITHKKKTTAISTNLPIKWLNDNQGHAEAATYTKKKN